MKKSVRLNQVLKELMKRRRVSAKELSADTGVPQSTISTYLSSSKASYDPVHLLTLATFFDVSIEFLLLGEISDSRKILESLLTENIFDGFLKVKIERVLK